MVKAQINRLFAIGAILIVCAFTRQSYAQHRAQISGPKSVVSTPDSAIPLKISLALPNVPTTAIQLRPTAGSVQSLRRLSSKEFEAQYHPPVVALPTTVVFDIIVNGQSLTPKRFEMVVSPTRRIDRKRSSGPFALDVPAFHVLGSGVSPIVFMRPNKGVKPILHVNVGTLSAIENAPNGLLQATYTPPTEKFPQTAIFVALSPDGEVVDSAAVLLVGTPTVKTSSAPRAQVRVRVANKVFGPFRADSKGDVDVAVLVPPGYRDAEALAVDMHGTQRTAPVSLQTPPYKRAFAVCPPGQESLIYVVVRPDGSPDRAQAASMSVSKGILSKPTTIQPGVVRADFVPPPMSQADETFSLRASLGGDSTTEASCERSLVGESPKAVSIRFDRGTHRADATKPIRVTLDYAYPGERKALRANPRLEVTLGQLGPPRPVSTGFEVDWTLPAKFEGASEARITAFPNSNLATSRTVALRSGPSKSLTVAASTSSLVADGFDTSDVTVTAKDAYGNPVLDARFESRAEGSVGPFASLGQGRFVATYRAPQRASGFEDRIVIRDSESSAEGRVSLRLTAGGGPVFVWARVGYSSNFGNMKAPFGAIGVGVRTSWLEDRFFAGLEVEHRRGSNSQPDGGRVEDVTSDVSVTPVLLRGGMLQQFGSFTLFAAVGAGFAVSHVTVESESSGKAVDSKVGFAASPRLGGFFKLGPGAALLETGYLYAPVNTAIVEGNTGGADMSLGYRLAL